MSGIIIGWDDTIANIPTGWNLCDGNGGRPNLLDKYLKSVGAAEDPGATGGATTHTHTDTAHNHTQDAHTHSATASGNDDTSFSVKIYSTAGSWPTTVGGSHNHTISDISSATPTNNTETVTINSTSNDPLYYKLAFIYDSAVNRYPVGSVILWNSATLPNGWSLHTGLKNAFAKCVGTGENPGGTGGASSHTHTTVAHNHTQNAHGHTSTTISSYTSSAGQPDGTGSTKYFAALSHTHTATISDATATNNDATATLQTTSSEPAYYKLSYIKNTGAAANRPKNSIVNWSGTIANIPNGYTLSDGDESSPNILGKFIKGANDSSELGNTGGSDNAHTHTADAHTHTQSAHDHTGSLANCSTTGVSVGAAGGTGWKGAHSHTFTPSATGTNQNTTITVNTEVNLPPYYKMAFIMQTIDLDVGAYAFMLN